MRVLLTGSHGMLGSSIAASWAAERPADELVTLSRGDVDLRDRSATRRSIGAIAPDVIIHAAAVVGGIAAKLEHPTRYLEENLLIDTSVIGSAIELGVSELLNIGSAAVYPERSAEPFAEDDLLTAPLEPANEGYAIAKIAGMKLCEYASVEYGLTYRTAIPSNLYGPRDDYTPSRSHLIASAIAKTVDARNRGATEVAVWGDGTARREFTFADDLSRWLVGQVGRLEPWPLRLNLGTGVDHSIADYYGLAREIVGFRGELVFDASKPAGAHQRLLDSAAARELGWDPRTDIRVGMEACYLEYATRDRGVLR